MDCSRSTVAWWTTGSASRAKTVETKTPYQYLEKLVALATGEGYLESVRDAKARYFRAAGEVFEDDPFFEPRMNCFIE